MRRRLALLVTATTSLVLAAFLVPLGLLLQQVAADRGVVSATREAEAVVPLVATVERPDLSATLKLMDSSNVGDVPLTVFLPNGDVLGADAPRSRAVELAMHGHSI